MSRILVTGAIGTLGRPLLAELQKRGHEVTGCDLRHSEQIDVHRADVSEWRQIAQLMLQSRPEYVYHLAAEFGRLNGEEYYEQCWRTNVIGTRHILELQRNIGFRLIFASSSEIYGQSTESLIEDLSLKTAMRPMNDYAITKHVNELQIRNCSDRWGTETMVLRLFNAYGPGEHYHAYRSVVCLFAWRALHNLPYNVYENYHRVFMYIEDLIPTLANACERFSSGAIVNIGGTDYRSVRELSDIVLNTCGRDDSLVRYMPLDQHNTMNKRPEIGRARTLLGHAPRITLEDGVPRTIDWMRSIV